MSLVRAFVDVNIFCRCANYLVHLQNIQNVDMIVCMYNCLDLYIDTYMYAIYHKREYSVYKLFVF